MTGFVQKEKERVTMKRKTVAAVLALVLAMGMGTTSMAASTHTSHGTKDKAVVTGTSTMDNNNLSGETQFYINVDKDATGGEVVIPGTEDITGAGGICHYDVNWKYSKTTKLSVTVPLYVCMYGYGGDGKVVTPKDDAYKMTNNSTYTDERTVESIYACYQVEKIKSSEEYTPAAEGNTYEESYIKPLEAKLFGAGSATKLTDAEKSGQYGYYYKEEAGVKKYEVVKLSDCDTHDKDSACTNKGTNEYFYRDTFTTNVTVPANTGSYTNGLKTGDIQYANEGKAKDAALKIEVPTIKAELYTWELRPANAASSLKAGEIAMTLNNLDLSKVAASENNTMDIKDLKWAVNGDGGTLKLPIKAAIAGGSVNEEGCVPVVRVTYTVSPAEDGVTGGNYKAVTIQP